MSNAATALQAKTYWARDEGEALVMMAADPDLAGATVEARAWVGRSVGRMIVTPIALVVAGWAVGAAFLGSDGILYGLAAAVFYVLYVFASQQGTLTVTYRRL